MKLLMKPKRGIYERQLASSTIRSEPRGTRERTGRGSKEQTKTVKYKNRENELAGTQANRAAADKRGKKKATDGSEASRYQEEETATGEGGEAPQTGPRSAKQRRTGSIYVAT